MSFQIERGLFRLDFIDHHAILGVPVDADIKDIRKRYLKIARRLHPDSCASESEVDRQHASQLLSKLVNPAWEKLSQEKDRTEYALLLKLKGQQAVRQLDSLEISSSVAKQLSTASNPDHFYQTSLKDLAIKQFDLLDQVLELTAQMSELNLVYLMRKENDGGIKLDEPKRAIYTGSNLPDSSQAEARTLPLRSDVSPSRVPQSDQRLTLADQYYRRAEALVAKNNFSQAILELRDAQKIEPNSSRCLSLQGMIYLKQNQMKMAQIYFNQALKVNPNDLVAQEGLQKLGQQNPATAKSTTGKAVDPKAGAQRSSASPNKPNDKSGGGLFGGLFGGKKK
jgi:curved DNA-binding protein CbpA